MRLHSVSLRSKDGSLAEGDSNRPLHYIVIHLCIKQMAWPTVTQTCVAKHKNEKSTHRNTLLFQMQDQVSQLKHAYVVFVIFYLYVIIDI